MNLQPLMYSLKSGKQSARDNLKSYKFSVVSTEEKPGVSTTKPPFSVSNNSVCLVVCLPRPSFSLTSPVLRLRSEKSAFKMLDLPTP